MQEQTSNLPKILICGESAIPPYSLVDGSTVEWADYAVQALSENQLAKNKLTHNSENTQGTISAR